MAKRFVIHIHRGCGPEHYDLMLEHGPALATWRLSRAPENLADGETIEALRIPDHRLAYLDYEGPVSCGLGNVVAWDAGGYEVPALNESRWEFRLAGRKLQGRFELRRLGGEKWALTHLADP